MDNESSGGGCDSRCFDGIRTSIFDYGDIVIRRGASRRYPGG